MTSMLNGLVIVLHIFIATLAKTLANVDQLCVFICERAAFYRLGGSTMLGNVKIVLK